MVFKRMTVVLIAIALVLVAIGATYLLLSGNPSVVVPPPPGAAPKVTSTSPFNAAVGTPINAKVIATFSKAMNPSTITNSTFSVKHGTVAVPGTISYAGTTATFTPASNLGAATAHTVTITTGAKDVSGVGIALNFVWKFTTGQLADTTPPLVSFTSPVPGATGTPINAKVLATFSKAMDPSTISASTFTVKHGTTAVTGSVTYAGTTATFVPSGNLAPSTTYTAAITTGAKDSIGHPLASNYAWSFTTGAAQDTSAPRVSFTSPPSGATGTPVNTQILATFTEAMDPSTVTPETFTLSHGAIAVQGAVSFAGTTATFVPSDDLAASTAYTATVTTGARDLAGNALQASFVWTFATGAAPDTIAPRVTSTSPVDGATDVAVNRDLSATFSEAMDPSTVTVSSFVLMQGTTPLSGLVTYAGRAASFNPADDFAFDTTYTATVTNGARDLAGNALQANFVWSFTTGRAQDTVRPTVTSMNPSSGATDVPRATDVSAIFSEAMDPSSITVSSFVLMQGTTAVPGLVSYAGLTATFDPSSDLASGTTYTATVSTEARDLAGNTLQSDSVWSFSTGTSACGQSTINLGSAAAFAVLGGSTVTNTGGTTVTGDLGSSPGTEITGFPPGTVVGAIHAGDTVAVAGLADMTTAYNDGMSRTLCQITVDGNLGGQTLAPGLYWSGSSLEVSSGTLTLDAQGDSNGIFIFKMDSSLTTTEGMQVILAGGAQAKNIFWIVGSSATLGTNSVFHGTIFADQSITLTTGASLDGRALARIGAVTLDFNAVTLPAA
jgi:hypothetical protein